MVIETLVRELPVARSLSDLEINFAIDIITCSYRWPDMGIRNDEFRERALALREPALVDIINLVYFDHLRRTNKPRFADKTPPYINIVPELCLLYPGAKFIHLIRDGRDVAMSIIDVPWNFRCYQPDFVWTARLRTREAYRHSALSERILDVKYEDLVAELEPTVRRICAFLGEEFEPAMLTFRERLDMVPERERSIHHKLSRPVSGDAVGQWRSKLSAVECFVMEACMHRELSRWGYELRFSNPAWRPLFRVASRLLGVIGPLISRAIMYMRRRDLLPRTIYI